MEINQEALDLERNRCLLLDELKEAKININNITNTNDLFEAIEKPFDIQILIADIEIKILKLLHYNTEAFIIHEKIHQHILLEEYEMIDELKKQLFEI